MNQALGGLQWVRYGVTKTGQHVMRGALLAPDWTFANLSMARDLFVNMPGMEGLIGKTLGFADVVLPDLRFRWALAYNMRAAFYGTAMANLLNYAFTSYKDGEGRWLHENDNGAYDHATGFKSRVELPWNREDGRKLYMDIFKQFAEPVRLFLEPTRFVNSKMGVLPRVFQTTVLGQDSFGNKIAGATDGPYQDLVARAAVVTGQFMPISGQSLAQELGTQLSGESGGRGVSASMLSSALGFSIRSEDKRIADAKASERRIRQEMARVSTAR